MSHNMELPENFGRYHILKVLEKGGTGTDYLAEDTSLQRRVVLKVPRLTGENAAENKARFKRGAQIAADVAHPNICQIHEIGEIDGIPYLTTPLLKGEPLAEQLRSSSPWPATKAVQLIRKTASALTLFHQRGVIHRNLKPNNILLVDGEPVLKDFGLARSFEDVSEDVTDKHAQLGTPSYMSPEQVNGENKTLGPGTDIWSLGVILYELVTGRLPFQGNRYLLFAQIVQAEIEPPSKVLGKEDPALDALCLKAMAREVSDRFTSLEDFIRALDRYAVPLAATVPRAAAKVPTPKTPEEKTTAYVPPPAEYAPPPVPRAESAPVRTLPPEPSRPTSFGEFWWKKHSLLWATGGGVLLLLGGILLVSSLGKQEPEKSTTSPTPPVELRILDVKPLTIEAGQSETLRVKVQRSNCPGVIQLELIEQVPGVVLDPGAEIPADSDDGTITLRVNPNARPGKWHLRLMARAPGKTYSVIIELTVTRKPGG